MIIEITAVLLAISGLVFSGSVFWLLMHARAQQPFHLETSSRNDVLLEERLRAYREIMTHIIHINRTGVQMSELQFKEHTDRLALGNESELTEPYEEFVAVYQRYFYIIHPDVKSEVSNYLDYLNTYHDDSAQVGQLLSKSANIAQAIRTDLGLEPIFDDEE